MSNLQWDKVTWYSKTLALILFIALPFVGFYLGVDYGKIQTSVPVTQATAAGIVATATSSNYYSNTAEWQIDTDANGGFSIAYPIDFDNLEDNYTGTPSIDWRNGVTSTGVLYFTLTIQRLFEPHTNLGDVTLTVGSSANANAVAKCLSVNPNSGETASTSTITINGIPFTIFHGSDAGAGNFYQTTSYRTLHAGQCYAIEYTIHSTDIGAYSESYNLQPFDQAKIDNVMQAIIGTFKFQ